MEKVWLTGALGIRRHLRRGKKRRFSLQRVTMEDEKRAEQWKKEKWWTVTLTDGETMVSAR